MPGGTGMSIRPQRSCEDVQSRIGDEDDGYQWQHVDCRSRDKRTGPSKILSCDLSLGGPEMMTLVLLSPWGMQQQQHQQAVRYNFRSRGFW